MPKVTFSKAYDYHVPNRASLVSYDAGWSGDVPKAHAVSATEAGVLAEPYVEEPAKGEAGKGSAAKAQSSSSPDASASRASSTA